jgi:hypothetical protein
LPCSNVASNKQEKKKDDTVFQLIGLEINIYKRTTNKPNIKAGQQIINQLSAVKEMYENMANIEN